MGGNSSKNKERLIEYISWDLGKTHGGVDASVVEYCLQCFTADPYASMCSLDPLTLAKTIEYIVNKRKGLNMVRKPISPLNNNTTNNNIADALVEILKRRASIHLDIEDSTGNYLGMLADNYHEQMKVSDYRDKAPIYLEDIFIDLSAASDAPNNTDNNVAIDKKRSAGEAIPRPSTVLNDYLRDASVTELTTGNPNLVNMLHMIDISPDGRVTPTGVRFNTLQKMLNLLNYYSDAIAICIDDIKKNKSDIHLSKTKIREKNDVLDQKMNYTYIKKEFIQAIIDKCSSSYAYYFMHHNGKEMVDCLIKNFDKMTVSRSAGLLPQAFVTHFAEKKISLDKIPIDELPMKIHNPNFDLYLSSIKNYIPPASAPDVYSLVFYDLASKDIFRVISTLYNLYCVKFIKTKSGGSEIGNTQGNTSAVEPLVPVAVVLLIVLALLYIADAITDAIFTLVCSALLFTGVILLINPLFVF